MEKAETTGDIHVGGILTIHVTLCTLSKLFIALQVDEDLFYCVMTSLLY
jgi:hypothetical protein